MYKNYKWYRDNFKPGKLVKYRIMVKGFRKDHPQGFISQYPGIIKGREGNSFYIQMKTLSDVKRDNELGKYFFFSGLIKLVPAGDLILYKGDPVEKGLSEEEKAIYKLVEDLRYDQRHDYNTMDYDMKSLLKKVIYAPEVVVAVKVPIVKKERKPTKKTKKKIDIFEEYRAKQEQEAIQDVRQALQAEPGGEPPTRKKIRINPEVTGENILPPDAKRQHKEPKRYK